MTIRRAALLKQGRRAPKARSARTRQRVVASSRRVVPPRACRRARASSRRRARVSSRARVVARRRACASRERASSRVVAFVLRSTEVHPVFLNQSYRVDLILLVFSKGGEEQRLFGSSSPFFCFRKTFVLFFLFVLHSYFGLVLCFVLLRETKNRACSCSSFFIFVLRGLCFVVGCVCVAFLL